MKRPEADYMSASEAAEHLGVKRATLYAYVSRGLISREQSDGRSNLYLRADVERLRARSRASKGHGAVAEGALRWGAPILESSITRIDHQHGPAYRGIPLQTLLTSGASFEAVAELLWTGAEIIEHHPRWPSESLGFDPTQSAELLRKGATPVDAIRLALAHLTARDTMDFALPPEAELQRARALIPRLAAAAGLLAGPARCEAAIASESVSAILTFSLGAPPKAREAIDAALIVCADHELNVSSFTARVIASAQADLLAVVTGALSAFSGARHGTFSARVEALLAEIERVNDVERVVFERLRRGERVPGFGHPFYPNGDPRVSPLLEHARALADGFDASKPLEVLLELIDVMRQAGYPGATLDVGLVALTRALALPPGSGSAIFAVGRTAGWVAHALEQRQHKHLLRPTAKYVG